MARLRCCLFGHVWGDMWLHATLVVPFVTCRRCEKEKRYD